MTLRSTRQALHLTQAQMAARLGIGHSTYARYEGMETRAARRNYLDPHDPRYDVHLPAWLTLAVAQLATEIKQS